MRPFRSTLLVSEDCWIREGHETLRLVALLPLPDVTTVANDRCMMHCRNGKAEERILFVEKLEVLFFEIDHVDDHFGLILEGSCLPITAGCCFRIRGGAREYFKFEG